MELEHIRQDLKKRKEEQRALAELVESSMEAADAEVAMQEAVERVTDAELWVEQAEAKAAAERRSRSRS